MDYVSKYRVLLKNVNVNTKVSEIKKFFKPIRIKDAKVLKRGIAVAYFKNSDDVAVALTKHGELHGSQIKVESYETDLFINEVKPSESKRIWPEVTKDDSISEVSENGRLFIRNLSYECTEEDLIKLLKPFGAISEVHLSYDTRLQKSKGFAFVSFIFPVDAVSVLNKLDKTKFQGRLLHILPGKVRPDNDKHRKVADLTNDDEVKEQDIDAPLSEFQRKKLSDLKASSSVSHNWNTLFINPDAVSTYLCAKFGVTKEQLYDSTGKQSVSVRLAHGEAQLVHELRDFLLQEGVRLDLLEEKKVDVRRDRLEVKSSDTHRQLSGTAFIIKNLPVGTKEEEVRELIQNLTKSGGVSHIEEPKRIILPPLGITAIVEYAVSQVARLAYKALSYEPYKDGILFLQWAPEGILSPKEQSDGISQETKKRDKTSKKINNEGMEDLIAIEETADLVEPRVKIKDEEVNKSKLMVKANHGKKRPNIELLQRIDVKEHQQDEVEAEEVNIKNIKRSKYDAEEETNTMDSNNTGDQARIILVRNVAFQASEGELTDLFKPVGGLLKVRMPKKVSGGHRGFAFVEFVSDKHAESALHTFGTDTHFYGRRLNIEYAKST